MRRRSRRAQQGAAPCPAVPSPAPWQRPTLGHRPVVQDAAIAGSLGSSCQAIGLLRLPEPQPGVPGPSPALRPRPGPRKLGPYEFCKNGISSSASRVHGCPRCAPTHAPTRNSPSPGRGPAAPWARPTPGGLSRPCSHRIPPTRAPLLCGAELGPASMGTRSGTGGSVGGCPSPTLPRDPGAAVAEHRRGSAMGAGWECVFSAA